MLKVFSHYFPLHVVSRLCLDWALLVVAVIALAVFRQEVYHVPINWNDLVFSVAGFSVTTVIISFTVGLYRPVDEDNPQTAFARLVLDLLLCLPAVYLVMWVVPWFGFKSHFVRLQVLALVMVVVSMRVMFNRARVSSMLAPKVLVVGTGPDAVDVERIFNLPENGNVQVRGFYQGLNEEPAVESAKIITGESLTDIVKRLDINEIIVAMRERRSGALPLRELLDCKLLGVQIFDLTSFHERVRREVRLDSLRTSWLIFGDGFRQSFRRVLVKRLFDLFFGTAILIATLPVTLITAILIFVNDRGPVFYRQQRVGLDGQVFNVIKFRSMRTDAEKDGQPRWAQTNDDRVTRIGRVIRKLRIDELPQLVNVIIGTMSLVGPRPERPYFVDQLSHQVPFYGVRHCVKPGLTGWAQVRYQYGSSGDDAIQKLQYDLYYVKNHTLVLDTLVLLETVRVVLTGEGAQ